mgnify:CR=1 FL=1
MKKKINMTVGRFQPFTLGHLNMIHEGTNNNAPCIIYQIKSKDIPESLNGWKVGSRTVKKSEINNILKYIEDPDNVVLSEHEKDIIKRPFSNELVNKELDIIKSNNKNLIYDVVYVSNMFEALIMFNDFIIEHSNEFEPGNLICGDDRYETYSKIVGKYDELDSILYNKKVRNVLKNKLNVLYLKRNQNGISGTKVREAIIKNDKSTFSSLMPSGVGNKMWFNFKDAFDNFINKLKGMINESNLSNNKVITNLVDYINESLSKKNIEKLEKFLTDENFDVYLGEIRQIVKRSKFSKLKNPNPKNNENNEESKNKFDLEYQIDKYLSYHGLTSNYFNSGADDIKKFIIDTFVKNNGSDLLEAIIRNQGLIYFNKLNLWQTYNFNTEIKKALKNIKIKENTTESDIDKIIDAIFNYDTPKSNNSNVGKGEILLKFILKSRNIMSSHGDISIYNDNSNTIENIEVKSSATKGTGARVSGLVRSNKEVSKHFCELYNKVEQKSLLFGGKQDLEERILKFFNNNIDVDLFIENVVKSIVFQYTDTEHPFTENLIADMCKVAISWNKTSNCVKTNNIDIDLYIQFIGALQTYLYYVQDGFTRFTVMNNVNKNFIICDFGNFSKDLLEKMINTFEYGNSEATGDIKNTRRSVSRIFLK